MIGNKKNSVEIFLLFAAAFFLIQSISVLTDSVKDTLLEQRMDQYGEWEYSLPGRFQTYLDPVAEKAGSVLILGIMQLAGGDESISIGSYDQAALDMARLTLVEGRLPEKSGEIAIEMEALIRLGLQYKIGMELELRLGVLQKTEGLTTDYIFTEKTFPYTVCGVIKSYSSGWATEGRHDIPNAIVTPDTQDTVLESFKAEGWQTEGIVFRNFVLFTLKRGYNGNSLTEYLNKAGIPSSDMIHNIKTYPENPYSVLDGVLQLLYIACSLIACCLLLMTVIKNISLQRISLQQLVCLGAGRGQIRSIVLWQCLFYVGGALPCGLLCGAFAGSGLIWLGTAITGTQISLRITGEGVFFSLLTGLAVTGVGAIIPALFSKQL